MTRLKKINRILLPLAWIYGSVQGIRNFLYDSGFIKSKKAPLKTIVIGNLTVGGTGKTPHVIWLATELSKTKSVAILSRGYKRNTKGFHWVNADDHPSLAGDEPIEMKSQLPDVPIAVDSNRIRALERMNQELDPKPDYVILDDGFQHRSLIPHYSIILSSAKRPYHSDYLMPAGRLRESKKSIRRCNSVIVTYAENQPIKNNHKLEQYRLAEDQNLFTSFFRYTTISAITEEGKEIDQAKVDAAFLVTGIADPEELTQYWESRIKMDSISFGDHHKYSQKDIDLIVSRFNKLEGSSKILITTGKDLVKLIQFPQICQLPLFCQNRELLIDNQESAQLIESILNHG